MMSSQIPDGFPLAPIFSHIPNVTSDSLIVASNVFMDGVSVDDLRLWHGGLC